MAYIDEIENTACQRILEERLAEIFSKQIKLEVLKENGLFIIVKEEDLVLGKLKVEQVKHCCTFLTVLDYEIKNKKLLLFKVAEYIALYFGYTCLLVNKTDSRIRTVLERRSYKELTDFLFVKEVKIVDIRSEQS